MDLDGQGRAAGLIRGYRREAGLTQRQLADMAGVSIGVVRDLEQGRTAYLQEQSARRLARALRLDRHCAGELTGAARGEAGSAAGTRAAARRGSLRIGVLGPLAAWRGGAAVPLGPAPQRAVLGLLALHPGTGLPRAAIIDALWGDDPPPTAVTMIQSYISRLRQLLGPVGQPRGQDSPVIAVAAGYRLCDTTCKIDLVAFGRLARRARDARAAGDLAAACARYADALALWRGEALADLDVLHDHPALTRLNQDWADAVTGYAEAASAAGWHDRALPQLRELIGRDPLNERAHARLMIALAGSGQQAAALAVYDDVRRLLDSQLGVSPGAELADAHARVLRQDIPAAASVGWAGTGRAAAPRAAGGVVVPRQLPGEAPHFVGRGAELAALTGLLDEGAGRTVVISAIGGTAGVGKTALAVHWAHQVAERWPDGQLYVDLRGFDPSGKPLTASEAVRELLDALDVPASRIPPALGAQVGLYRSLLAGRRLLVLLDNAADEAQVRPLLPGSPECLVVVTSRRQLAGLVATDGAHLLTLDVLNSAEAAEMLTGRLGTARTAEDHVAVGEIIAGCARLPLALSVAAARAASRPGFPLSALAGELRDARARLDVLDADDAASSVRAVFSWSYQKLSDPAARMFRLLGVHPGPDIATPAAASLAAVSPGRAHRLLGELARAHLIVEHSPGRFAFHDLLRSYAADRTMSCDGEAERSSARHRILDHYLHTAHSAALLLHPAREAPSLGVPQAGTSPEHLPGYESALAWFEAERHVLYAAIAQAAETGFDSHAWQIPLTLATFFDTRGYVHDWAAIQKFAVTAAERLGNQAGQAQAHRRVGAACILLGSYAEAISHLELALDLERQRGHSRGQAAVHLDFGRVFNGQGQHSTALRHVQRAADLYQEAGYAMGHADALNAVGWSYIQLGDYEQALACCRRAIALQQELGDRRGEAGTWDSLGYAYHHLGRHPDAVACYRRALSMLSGLGDRRHQAETLTHLGDTHHASGDLAAAHDVWRHALTILDDYDLGHPSAEGVRARLEIGAPSGVPPA